ncbi:ribonuclease H-like domain-containing protein [Tanacetum coccineum]
MFLSQRKYAVEILVRANMVNCNPSRTSFVTVSKLGDHGDPVCLYMQDPRESYFLTLKRILRYVRGCSVYLDNNLLSWSSKRQPTLSRSSAETGYLGVANAVAETWWLRNLLHELHTPLSSLHLFIVIMSVMFICLLIRFNINADIFTKGLPSALFEEFRTSLSVRCPSAPTAEEC